MRRLHGGHLALTAIAAALIVAVPVGAVDDPIPPQVIAAEPVEAGASRDVASYDLTARLDPDEKTVTGTARITWRNPSPVETVPDLWFHLYLNAFRDRESTFWRESRGELRDVEMPADGWGSIELDALRLGDADLLPSLTYQAPDDGNEKDRTVARVVLPRPVPPGGHVELDVAFTARLPKAYARTGYAGDFVLVGQWFPKLAVYEPPGRRGRSRGGWNAHQFHAHSEFYADFGRYRAALTVPRRFVVGATGVRTARTDNADGTTTHVYQQAGVHDFAWAASPHFVEVTRRFVAAREVTAAEYAAAAALVDRPIEAMRLGDVDVRLLLQPAHAPQADRHFEAAWRAIEAYGLAYGPYPHATLTMVDPPLAAIGTGGMEYPTFFTTGTLPILDDWPFDRIREPEIVVIHEFGHQYFQGMVASNEFEEAWLDEGLTTWTTAKVMDAWLGADRSMAELAGLRVGLLDLERFGNHRGRGAEAIRQPSWSYDTGYSFNSYERPSLALRTLERLVGRQTMARIMRTYVERWRFRHPSSDDFFAVASEVAGRDLRPFFRGAFESPAIVDYAIGSVTRETGHTAVTVRRDGDLAIPVTVAFKFAGRPVERRTWDGAGRWTRFAFEYPEPLEWVEVDPDRHVALDVSWLNNSRIVAGDRRPSIAMTSRWLLVIQQAVGWLSF
jgi:hypothetical protein